jgi:hypothetical protein
MRLDFSPLERLVGGSAAELAEQLGVTARTVQRYRRYGVPVAHADNMCCHAGVLPVEAWPDWYDIQISSLERECADPDCDVVFVPSYPRRKYCGNTCRDRRAKAAYYVRRYAADDTFRAMEVERARQYRQVVARSKARRQMRGV